MTIQKKKTNFLLKIFPRPIFSLILLIIWLLLLNNLNWGGFLLGLLLCLSLPFLTQGFYPEQPVILSYTKALFYLLIVMKDIVVANLIVARLILFVPSQKLRTCWLCLPIDLSCPEARTVLAGTITLTPGTVSCDFSKDNKNILVHCLDSADFQATVQGMKNRYEKRLKEIFQ